MRFGLFGESSNLYRATNKPHLDSILTHINCEMNKTWRLLQNMGIIEGMKIKTQPYKSESQRKVRALLLDLDGVIIKSTFKVSEAKRALIEKLEKLGLDISTISVDDTFMDIMAKAEKQVVESKKLDVEYLKKSMSAVLDKFDIQALSQSELIDGAKSVIDELRRRGLKLGLITNSGRVGVKMALEKFALSGCFDVIVTRNDVERIKPSGEGIQKALSTLGCAPNEAIYVGDSWADIVAAKNVGVVAIAIVGGISPKEVWSVVEEDALVRSATAADLFCGSGANHAKTSYTCRSPSNRPKRKRNRRKNEKTHRPRLG
jgi:HAD superfamily hydrolase (TIGR01509 family)